MRPRLVVFGFEQARGKRGRVENRFGEEDKGGLRPRWVVFGYEADRGYAAALGFCRVKGNEGNAAALSRFRL